MSVISNNILAGSSGQGGGAAGYTIDRSLRFNSGDAAYLNRTPSSAGNRKTWTWSGWIKRVQLGSQSFILQGEHTTGHGSIVEFNSSDQLDIYDYVSSYNYRVTTSKVFRDPSAWYHIIVAFDSTQSTAADRVKIYVNGGSAETDLANSSYPSQNSEHYMNSSVRHLLGAATFNNGSIASSNIYFADIHFIDGQALAASDFGEYDDNNVWQPKEFAGTYGTNGFHLDFSDNSSNAALGTDTSGNGNTWTVNNLSVAAGAGNDSLRDSPEQRSGQTDSGSGGDVVGNYATLNPLDNPHSIVLSNGNLDWEIAGLSFKSMRGNFMMSSGKWYFETKWNVGAPMMGIARPSDTLSSHLGATANAGIGSSSNATYKDGSQTTSGVPSHSTGDILMCAFDADAGKVWFGVNGSWYSSGDPAAGTNERYSGLTDGTWMPAVTAYNSSGSPASINFGQRAFAYTAPSGYKALCTANLSDPTIADGSQYFDTKLYTGNGGTQSITGLDFSPDLVWLKRRNVAGSNQFYDVVRGATKVIYSDQTTAEETFTNGLTSFDNNGFSIGSLGGINAANNTHAAWAWDAGSSTVSNTDGTITSSVRANLSAGTSIVSYTGSANGTVGHGLVNAAPEFIIAKSRTVAKSWVCYHKALGKDKYLLLNSSNASGSASGVWGSAEPTSSVFGLENSSTGGNTDGDLVAYCFAPVEGYSSFGSYTGNGSADGPFVFTGFRPRWIIIKRTNSTGVWGIWDSARNSFNASTSRLQAESGIAEINTANTTIDILSNGFKPRAADSDINAASSTYIYAAFAENPFKTSRAR